MSAQQNEDNPETLFSFELLVDFIRLEEDCGVSHELAVGVRLLDFPTLLIYQPQQSSSKPLQDGHDKKFTFNRGKCCFFKMNLDSVSVQLSGTPLYVMVLDVKEDTPKLVGSSVISLSKTMERIRQDVDERGVSSPSSHTEKGLGTVYSLKGEKIGSISLSYKLLCLGASLLPHITEKRGLETGAPEGRGLQGDIEEGNEPLDAPMVEKSGFNTNTNNKKGDNATNLSNKEKQVDDDDGEEDLNIFCPPHLYYTNSAKERDRPQVEDYNLFNLDPELFTFEDSCSEDESKSLNFPKLEQKARPDAETSVEPSNVLGEALRKLPLLNALLVELSQLNVQNVQQSSNVHPSPDSPEPSARYIKTSAKPVQSPRPGTSLHSKHSPRFCSTPVAQSPRVNMENKQDRCWNQSKSCSKSSGKKLVYGTTKTFNLRLKQICPPKAKQRECVKLQQNEAQSNQAKGKMKTSHKTTKFGRRRKTRLNPSPSLNENVETVMQSVTVDSALRGTVTVNKKSHYGIVCGKQDRGVQGESVKPSLPDRDWKCIHVPSADGDDVPRGETERRHHSESDQSQSEPDGDGEKIQSPGSSRRSSSTKSSSSASSRDRDEEADYTDDFNSLEPSDAYSPDPASSSSPEPRRAKTPKSPLRPDLRLASDSGSEAVRRRAARLPVPVKAPSSPQRVLKGTHVIRPRIHTSALSLSSDDDGGESASSQTANSRKQVTASGPGAESFKTPRGQRGESGEDIDSPPMLSPESIPSVEPQEAQELEDELGSLDFRKEYQHVSQLVASKLPGYTL